MEAHPVGDDENRPQKAIPAAVKAMVVDTLGGRVQVSWDPESAATPFGQLVFFAEFLEVSGLFDAWVEECPLIYNSPNAPKKRDVLGTWNLSILADHGKFILSRPHELRVLNFSSCADNRRRDESGSRGYASFRR